jgi:squalene synthase HpnC
VTSAIQQIGDADLRLRARTENFSVASAVLGRSTREHLLAIYAFARYVDELGDVADGDRVAHLDTAERELERAFAGTTTDPLFLPLSVAVAAHGLPREPFVRLIEANRLDQVKHEYETFDELLRYCELSANPVGRLVLHVFGAATPERVALSDDVCTALQLVEHLQDVGEDAARGRVYLPRDEMRRFGVRPADLRRAGTAPQLRSLLAFQADRAARLLDSGNTLVGTLHARARLAVAGYVGGGRAALSALARAEYDVLGGPPRASRQARALASAHALFGRA